METTFYILLFLFVLAEIFTAVRYSKSGSSDALKSTIVPSGTFMLYLLALCIFQISIPYLVLSLATVTVFLHTFVGIYLNLYRRSKTFDRYLHGFGSFSYALLLYLTLSKLTAAGGSVFFRAVFVAVIGMASGIVFEIVEFVHDLKNKTDMQRGLRDTDFDLIFDVIGSIAAAILASLVYL